MRVGVFALTADAEAGGGFTIEEDILRALADVGGRSRHDVFRFVRSTGRSREGSAGGLPVFHIGIPRSDGPPARLARAGRRVRAVLGGNVGGPDWSREPRWLYEGVRQSRADLILCLTPRFFPSPDVPFVTIVWDLQHRLQPWFPEVSGGGEWNWRDGDYEKTLPRASRVIVGTQAGLREVSSFYRIPPGNIRVVPHPTPSFALEAAGEAEAGPVPGEFEAGSYLFYPAQFWPHKNHVTTLRALKRLRDGGLDLSVVFCGSDKGNEEWVRAESRRLGLAAEVHFLGFVTRERLIRLYRRALALVYPSWFGPENLPALEAFALGCPVIAAQVDGADEQLGDAAILFEPADDGALASAVRMLREDRMRREDLIRLGKERALRSTPVQFAEGLIRIVDEFVGPREAWPPGAWGPEPSRRVTE